MKKFYEALQAQKDSVPQRYELQAKKLVRKHELGKCTVEFEFIEEWDDDIGDVTKSVDIFLCFKIEKITDALRSMYSGVESSYVINWNSLFSDRSVDTENNRSLIIGELLETLKALDLEINKLFSPAYYYKKYFEKKENDLAMLNKQLIFEYFVPNEISDIKIEKFIKKNLTLSKQESMSELMRNETDSLCNYLKTIIREQL